ncbi:hypothetical protein Ciccas_006549 [Cichlidogyrus casuarinus]|uniref:Ig-like domain-containing protein n=1 Tax=Cichlidogyrus casuarinus TaxID=1844966 RepID=A0ABD2Q5F7_9PLAT
MSPPEIVPRLPEQIWIVAGEPVKIQTSVKGNPRPSVEWFHNNRPLFNSPQCILNHYPDGSIELVMNKPNQMQGGRYSIMARNPAGQDSCHIDIEINEPIVEYREPPVMQPKTAEQPPRFVRGPVQWSPNNVLYGGQQINCSTRLEIKEMTPAILDVEVVGYPEPQVAWFCNGKPVNPDGNHELYSPTKLVHCLTINPWTLLDSGTYKVVAMNSSGQAELLFPVQVIPQAAPANMAPRFIEKPGQKLTVPLGETVVLNTRVEGFPEPVVSWHKDEKLITPDSYPDSRVTLNIDGLYSQVVIRNFQPEDVGLWQCLASNKAGTATARINISYPKPPVEMKEPTKMDAGPNPMIMRPPDSICVQEGQTAHFMTSISARPPPNVTWILNGQPVPTGPPAPGEVPRFFQRFDGLMHHLEIRECTPNDAGMVTVMATRSDLPPEMIDREPGSKVFSSAELQVVPFEDPRAKLKPVPRKQVESIPPSFSEKFATNLMIQLDGNFVINCTAQGSPNPTITWFKNGIQIYPRVVNQPTQSEKYELVVDNNRYQLFVNGVDSFDAGQLLARAENELGVAVTCTTVKIDLPQSQEAIEPRFIKALPERIQVKPGDSAKFDCEVEANPPVNFRWFVNGIIVLPQDQRYKVSNALNSSTLIIPKLKREDLPGKVSIQAASPLGTQIVSTTIMEMVASTESDLNIVSAPSPVGLFRFARSLPEELKIEPDQNQLMLDVEVEQLPPGPSLNEIRPTFSWYLNGIEIDALPRELVAEKYKTTQYHPGHSRLTIDRPGTWDLGVVMCKVTRPVLPSDVPLMTQTNISQSNKAPFFRQQLAPCIQGVPGADLVFDVSAEGSPRPEVIWNVSSPETGSRCEVLRPDYEPNPNSYSSRLIIHSFNPLQDSQTEIKAVASNLVGTTETICQVQHDELQFVTQLPPQCQIEENQRVTLTAECNPNKKPVEFHWFMNGVEIRTTPNQYTVKRENQFTSTLAIERPRISDAGSLTVEISSPQTAQRITSTCQIQIIQKLQSQMNEPKNVEKADLQLMKPLEAKVHQTPGLMEEKIQKVE